MHDVEDPSYPHVVTVACVNFASVLHDKPATVAKMVDDEEIVSTLGRMGEEAAETESRCEEPAGSLQGRKTAIRNKARETKGEAVEMMSTYLGEDAEGLDGLEFLVMAEAGAPDWRP